MVKMYYAYSKGFSRKMIISAGNFCDIENVNYKCCNNGKNVCLNYSTKCILRPHCQQNLMKNFNNTYN